MDDKKLILVLRALSDPNRFRMVQEIAAAGELSCGQVVELFDLSQPTISHHMKILTHANVLSVRREGQHCFISVKHVLLAEVAALLPRRLSARADAARRTRRVSQMMRRPNAPKPRARDNHA